MASRQVYTSALTRADAWLPLYLAIALRIGAASALPGERPSAVATSYYDCTGADVTERAVKKAYRRAALEYHPDKGGSSEVAADLVALRDSWVREPLRFHIFRAMFETPQRRHQHHGSVVEIAVARVVWKDDWPYLEVQVTLEHHGRLSQGGSWSLAFGLKGVSTVHYRGDATVGGFNVCCDFVAGSRCQRRPRSLIGAEQSDSCQSDSQGAQETRGCGDPANDTGGIHDEFLVSDCPLPSRFTASARRPLHLNNSGQWGTALQVRDVDGAEVACVALAFTNEGKPSSLGAAGPQAADAIGSEKETVGAQPATGQDPNGHAQEQNDNELPRTSTGEEDRELPPSSRPAVTVASFRHMHTGKFCEDGADLLEGPVDDYGGLSPFGGSQRADAKSSLFYGSRCREKCRQRRRCLFYTVYSSGWCQLSTRCDSPRGTGDPLTITFKKIIGASSDD
eukprot:TRINITY_DN28754_c0_g1_i1.p1 TRINITY_DN28754_c0_g1~~TRINITY_DN28754_c0_g1_i1.p1  ORF type:complete len:452 (-),score=46.45 TRINITY_DN28754_c0_g1_i1:88-1443(-)